MEALKVWRMLSRPFRHLISVRFSVRFFIYFSPHPGAPILPWSFAAATPPPLPLAMPETAVPPPHRLLTLQIEMIFVPFASKRWKNCGAKAMNPMLIIGTELIHLANCKIYINLGNGEEANKENDFVSIAGRIVARRAFGKLAFLTLRYVDMIANPEVGDTFRKRAKIVSEIRKTVESFGFVDVETPVL